MELKPVIRILVVLIVVAALLFMTSNITKKTGDNVGGYTDAQVPAGAMLKCQAECIEYCTGLFQDECDPDLKCNALDKYDVSEDSRKCITVLKGLDR